MQHQDETSNRHYPTVPVYDTEQNKTLGESQKMYNIVLLGDAKLVLGCKMLNTHSTIENVKI